MENKNLPAFPLYLPENNSHGFKEQVQQGLTKREYLAAIAMQGWISCQHIGFTGESEDIAKRSIACADALLTELNKQP